MSSSTGPTLVPCPRCFTRLPLDQVDDHLAAHAMMDEEPWTESPDASQVMSSEDEAPKGKGKAVDRSFRPSLSQATTSVLPFHHVESEEYLDLNDAGSSSGEESGSSESDSGAEENGDSDSDEEEVQQVKGYAQPARFIRPEVAEEMRVLEATYHEVSSLSKKVANDAHEWFLRIFSKLEDFDLFFQITTSHDGETSFLEKQDALVSTSLSSAVTARYLVDGKETAGSLMLLSLLLDKNAQIRRLVESLDLATGTIPLSRSALATVANHGARESRSGGVYCLKSPDDGWIIGTAVGSTFRSRLNRKSYSTSRKAVASFTLGDQRTGRTDRVIVDAWEEGLEKYASHIKWLVHGMEAFAIVIFGSTLALGINTNVVDRAGHTRSRTPRQYHDLWVSLHDVVKTTRIPSRPESDEFRLWFDRHVASQFPYETPRSWYRLVRRIASEVRTAPMTHFEPLPASVWKGDIPRAHVEGKRGFKHTNKALGTKFQRLDLPNLSARNEALGSLDLLEMASGIVDKDDGYEHLLKYSRTGRRTGIRGKLNRYKPEPNEKSSG